MVDFHKGQNFLLAPTNRLLMLFKKMFLHSSSGESQLEKALKTVDEHQDVIVIVSPSPQAVTYLPFKMASAATPLPAHIRLLASTYYQLEVTRFDRTTLILTVKGGALIPKAPLSREETKGLPTTHILYWLQTLNSTFRGKNFPMRSHEIITLPGIDIEVTKLSSNGFPREAVFRFDRLLEDSSLQWITWDWGKNRYVPFIPPSPGEKISIRGAFD